MCGSATDTERSDQITGEELGGAIRRGNGKQSERGLAEKLMPPEHME